MADYLVYMWMIFFVYGYHFLDSAIAKGPGVVQDVCMIERFEALCPQDHVVVIQSALYGRMRISRCDPHDRTNIGCVVNVVAHLDAECSGRRECSVIIPTERLHAANKCPIGATPYLEATYNCTHVISGSRYDHACISNNVITLSSHSQGAISSHSSPRSSGYSKSCPWVIQAGPGQRINVTLVDFGLALTGGTARSSGSCHRYALLVEDGAFSPTPVCSGRQRVQHVYMSKTSRLRIEMVHNPGTEDQPRFLLQYSFVGCPDPDLHGNILVERDHQSAVLRCDESGQQWTLQCNGAVWNTEAGECAGAAGMMRSFQKVISEDWSPIKGIVLVVGAGIGFGAVIGMGFLASFCLKKFKHDRPKPPERVYYQSHTLPSGGKYAERWNSANGTLLPELNYNTCGRRSIPSGYGGHRRHPSYQPPLPLHPPDYESVTVSDNQRTLSRLPPPPVAVDDGEESDHTYEKPI